MNTIRVLQENLSCPQGVTFDEEGRVWCAEQTGGGLFCWTVDGQTTRIPTGGQPNSIVYSADYLWFSDQVTESICRVRVGTQAIETILTTVSRNPLAMPGNLVVDENGSLLFTCPGQPDGNQAGWVAARRTNGYAEVLTDGLAYPSGLVFMPGSLLIAEMHRQRIWTGFWNAQDLSWETIRVWATVDDIEENVPSQSGSPDPSGPAGMAASPDGNVFVTLYGQGLIRVFSAEGKFVRDIQLPGKYPTSCAFDPSSALGLLVTEAEQGQLLSVEV